MACEWISVKDKLPKHEWSVLFTDGVNIIKGYYYTDTEQSCFISDEYDHVECIKWYDTPTHWMPLPDVPTANK